MRHFSIKELTASATAKRKGIDNTPSESVVKNLTLLVENVLDPLREGIGNPVVVSSGYRSPALNKAVNGSPTSQHMKGEAADIISGGSKRGAVYNKKLAQYIAQNLDYDQIICEDCLSRKTFNCKWVHVSYREGNNRHQILRKEKNKSGYTVVSKEALLKG